jgi:hypothetical protein
MCRPTIVVSAGISNSRSQIVGVVGDSGCLQVDVLCWCPVPCDLSHVLVQMPLVFRVLDDIDSSRWDELQTVRPTDLSQLDESDSLASCIDSGFRRLSWPGLAGCATWAAEVTARRTATWTVIDHDSYRWDNTPNDSQMWDARC